MIYTDSTLSFRFTVDKDSGANGSLRCMHCPAASAVGIVFYTVLAVSCKLQNKKYARSRVIKTRAACLQQEGCIKHANNGTVSKRLSLNAVHCLSQRGGLLLCG